MWCFQVTAEAFIWAPGFGCVSGEQTGPGKDSGEISLQLQYKRPCFVWLKRLGLREGETSQSQLPVRYLHLALPAEASPGVRRGLGELRRAIPGVPFQAGIQHSLPAPRYL